MLLGLFESLHQGRRVAVQRKQDTGVTESVCTESLIQRMRFISMSATDKSLLLICSVDYQSVLWMLSDQFIQITP